MKCPQVAQIEVPNDTSELLEIDAQLLKNKQNENLMARKEKVFNLIAGEALSIVIKEENRQTHITKREEAIISAKPEWLMADEKLRAYRIHMASQGSRHCRNSALQSGRIWF